MRKVRIHSILGFCYANLEFLLWAANLRIAFQPALTTNYGYTKLINFARGNEWYQYQAEARLPWLPLRI